MRKKPKAEIPSFATEAEERKYWERHDSAGRVDWSGATRASFPNLKAWLAEKVGQ